MPVPYLYPAAPLDTLHLGHPCSTNPTRWGHHLGHCLPAYSPTTFAIRWCHRHKYECIAAIIPHVATIRNVKLEYDIPYYPISTASLNALGTSPSLESLEFGIGPSDFHLDDAIHMPRIRQIRCHVKDSATADFLHFMSKLNAPLLQELEVQFLLCTMADIAPIMQALSCSRASDTLLRLSLNFKSCHRKRWDVHEQQQLADFLRPLFALSQLERLAVRCPTSHGDTPPCNRLIRCGTPDLAAVARAFPAATALSLTAFTFSTEAGPRAVSPSPMPPGALAHFARGCPRLRTLELDAALDASCTWSAFARGAGAVRADHPLQILGVRLGAPAQYVGCDVGACAAFLHALFPNMDVPRQRVRACREQPEAADVWDAVLDAVRARQRGAREGLFVDGDADSLVLDRFEDGERIADWATLCG